MQKQDRNDEVYVICLYINKVGNIGIILLMLYSIDSSNGSGSNEVKRSKAT